MSKPEQIKDNQEYPFSKEETESLGETKQDFLDGKTTASDWN